MLSSAVCFCCVLCCVLRTGWRCVLQPQVSLSACKAAAAVRMHTPGACCRGEHAGRQSAMHQVRHMICAPLALVVEVSRQLAVVQVCRACIQQSEWDEGIPGLYNRGVFLTTAMHTFVRSWQSAVVDATSPCMRCILNPCLVVWSAVYVAGCWRCVAQRPRLHVGCAD
jgi:hypothetical protein